MILLQIEAELELFCLWANDMYTVLCLLAPELNKGCADLESSYFICGAILATRLNI